MEDDYVCHDSGYLRKAVNHDARLLKYVTICALSLSYMCASLNAATVTWDGGGADDFWSYTPGGKGNAKYTNWGPNGKLPLTGDDMSFGVSISPTGSYISDNDLGDFTIATLTFLDTAGAYTLQSTGGHKLSVTGSITNNSTNLQTINMALGLNATITVAATTGNIAIGGQVSGTGGISKTGTNSLLLTGSNIYSGPTTITDGLLLANNSTGSATGTGAVSVTGIFGGTGTIAPSGSNGITVNSGGIIAPGNGATPGTLTINFTTTTGGLTMNSGSGFEFHLGAVGIGDMLSIVSNSSGDVQFNNNNVNFMGTGALGSYKLFDTNTNNANAWTGLTVGGNGQITNGLTYSNLSNGYSAVFYMGGGSFGGDSGDIYVQVIPEPKAAMIGGLGLLILLLRHRRFN